MEKKNFVESYYFNHYATRRLKYIAISVYCSLMEKNIAEKNADLID